MSTSHLFLGSKVGALNADDLITEANIRGLTPIVTGVGDMPSVFGIGIGIDIDISLAYRLTRTQQRGILLSVSCCSV